MIKYNLASDSWGFREKLAIFRVMANGRYTMGSEVAKFETQFATKFGSKEAVMVNSGSSANLVGLSAMVLMQEYDLYPGDEVIVPAVSWSTTYYPITQLGLIPVFVDVDLDSFNIDLSKIKSAISSRTRAILAVNLLGNPCRLKDLKQFCRNSDIYLIEDNCESLGAKDGNEYAGSIGVFGTFSFFFSHHLQTMEGGMIITNDIKLADYMRSIRAHGWTRDLKTDLLYKKTNDPFEDSFKFVLPGYCVRPLEMSGAIGLVQLSKMDSFIKERRKNAKYFVDRFSSLNSICTIQKEHEFSSWFGFGVVLRGKMKNRRKELIALLAQNGIESRPIVAGNFTKQPVMKYLKTVVPNKLPVAEYIDCNGFFFGNDHRNLKEGINNVAELMEKISCQ